LGRRAEKVVTFSTTFLKQKKSVGGLNKAFFSPFETPKKGMKKALKGMYIA
jgi:hypothetical protein